MKHQCNTHPDMLPLKTEEDAYAFARRETFRVGDRLFERMPDSGGAYTDGKIIVYHDQQDSTSWAARTPNGGLHTGYFWTPEYAVDRLLESVRGVL